MDWIVRAKRHGHTVTANDAPAIPESVKQGLSGISLSRDQATLVMTTNEIEEIRVALVSRSELQVVSDATLLIALWADSQSSKNLAHRRKATIVRVDGAIVRTLHFRCEDISSFTTSDGQALTVFHLTITGVKEDEVPYATITSGVQFELNESHVRREELWKECEQHLGQLAGMYQSRATK